MSFTQNRTVNNTNFDHPCRPWLIRILHLMTTKLRNSNLRFRTSLLQLIIVILDMAAATKTRVMNGLARGLKLGQFEDKLHGYFTPSLFISDSVENIRNVHVGFCVTCNSFCVFSTWETNTYVLCVSMYRHREGGHREGPCPSQLVAQVPWAAATTTQTMLELVRRFLLRHFYGKRYIISFYVSVYNTNVSFFS